MQIANMFEKTNFRKKISCQKKQMATPPKELGDWMDFEAFLIYLKWRVGVT